MMTWAALPIVSSAKLWSSSRRTKQFCFDGFEDEFMDFVLGCGYLLRLDVVAIEKC